MARIKEYPSITSFDGTNDALAIEQTDGANNRLRKVSPAQLKQYMEAGDFEATGEIADGNGNILKDMAKSADVDAEIGDLSQTGLTGDNVAAQLGALKAAELKIGVLTSPSVTVRAGWRQYVDITLTEALPTGTAALFVIETASPASVFANYYDYDPSTLKIRIGVYNTSSNDVTGTYKVAYLYI